MRITSSKLGNTDTEEPILAAEGDPFSDMMFDDDEEFDSEDDKDEDSESDGSEPEDLETSIGEMVDTLEGMQEALTDYSEDAEFIEVENNIDKHLIAKCGHCHGVFISAVVQTEHSIEKITGVCPLCNEEGDQYLMWVINKL